MDAQELLLESIGFEWDDGNRDKNWLSHQVTSTECEEIFFNQSLYVADSTQQHEFEDRYYALGKTNSDRMLFIVFTIRKKHIRVISARDMSRKERKVYETKEEVQD